MKTDLVPFASLKVETDLKRRGGSSKFVHLLEASIREVGLAEPLKVAPAPDDDYVIIDGVLRYEAIARIREDPSVGSRFERVPVIAFEYSKRFEIRYQTDIYQDLLPSQLAYLVELLHAREGVTKQQIAASLGIAPATLRNYTGLWRLAIRGGICRRLVELMDVGAIPASNPYAWLRLTDAGIRRALEESFSQGMKADDWVEETISAPADMRESFSLAFVEGATMSLPERFYRQGTEVRTRKRSYGLRRGERPEQLTLPGSRRAVSEDAIRDHLRSVVDLSPSQVLRLGARSLGQYV